MNKKIATIAALLTVTASAFSFVACDGEDTLKLEASDAKTTERVEEVLQATEKAPTGIGEISLSATVEGGSSVFVCDAAGDRIGDEPIDGDFGSATVTASGWWNQEGDVDLTAHYSETGEDATEGYVFGYLRDGYVFFNVGEAQTIDLSTAVLSAIDISELVSSLTSITLPQFDQIELSGNISYDAIAKLALSYGTVSVSNDTIELDIDKTVASLVKDALQTVDEIKAETTLGDIAQSNAVKKIINSLFGKYTAQEFRAELVSAVSTMMPDFAQIAEVFLPKVAETDQTAHDYLMTVLNDKNISGMVLMYINPTLTDTLLADVTFNDLFGANFESVIESFRNVIKMEYKGGALTLNVAIGTNYVTVGLKDVSIKFSVNSSNVITAVELNCGTFTVESDSVYDNGAGEDDGYYCYQTTLSGSCMISVNMNSDKTIADISNVNTDLDATVGELLNPADITEE
ncbi:MAG: hypothetical protein ACI4MH_00285 [Candidatus Coproplasma sp.]